MSNVFCCNGEQLITRVDKMLVSLDGMSSVSIEFPEPPWMTTSEPRDLVIHYKLGGIVRVPFRKKLDADNAFEVIKTCL
jgi:hypothetical protein